MENCITYTKSIVENGWWEDACSSSYHPIPHVSAPGHKLQKPSKESGIFQSLGTINFVLFTKRQNQRGGAWPNRTQTHFRRHKHTARENQRYRSSAVKLASSSRTPRSLFLHHQGVRAPPNGNRWCKQYRTKLTELSIKEKESFQFCTASHTLMMTKAESMLSKHPVLRTATKRTATVSFFLLKLFSFHIYSKH